MFKKISVKKTKISAFSLVELSIALLIIGILIIGVSQGYGLVKSARISNARSITAKSPISQTQGLVAWYETTSKESFEQSEIKDGAQITKWKDISPSSVISSTNILTTTASANATYSQSSINKIPAIKFSGTGKLSIANFTQGASSQATIFMVVKLNYTPDTTNLKTLLDGYSSSNDFSFSIKSDVAQVNAGSSGLSTATANSFLNSGEYTIAIYFNGSNSKVFVNNTNSMLGGSAFNCGTNQLVGMTLGTNKSAGAGFSGYISEVAVFNRVIKSTERKEIFNYFSKKYKINISGV
jgi:Tfp pilus assembly protein PilE